MSIRELDINSKIENLCEVEKLIDELSEHYSFSSKVYGNIMVATLEAVNNAITHGNKKDPSKKVKIRYGVEDNTVKFYICDEGPGFDITTLPDPTLPENLEKPTGRGVFLMRNLADEISFNDTGSEVELNFNIK